MTSRAGSDRKETPAQKRKLLATDKKLGKASGKQGRTGGKSKTNYPFGMTELQWKFAQRYKEDPNRNGTAAYLAVYKNCSKKAAEAAASRLLRNVKVESYLNESTKKAMMKFDISQERILQELACIAFLDIADLVDDKGVLLPISEIPEHARRAIAGMDLEELFESRGGERSLKGLLKKLKVSDKKGALELIGKNLKMFTDKVDLTSGGKPIKNEWHIHPVTTKKDGEN